MGNRTLTTTFRNGTLGFLSAALILTTNVTSTAAETTLKVAVQTLPAALGNVHRSTSSSELYSWSAMFDPLTMVGSDAVVRPWLMTSWEAVNPTTWHFHLRDDVTFHNGEPFNADAVINTLTYLTSEAGLRESLSRVVSSVAAVRALDPYTVEITTHYPNLMLPAELGIIRIVAPKHWQELGPDAFALDPVGSGPYKVDNWRPGKVSLSGFKEGWTEPGFDRLELIQLGDPTTRTQGVLAGTIDIALVIGPDEVETLEAAGHTHNISRGAGAMGVAWLQTEDGPISDPRVRRALNYAINREAYISALLNNGTSAATQASPSHAIGWDPSLPAWTYDPEKAKALLAEAGYGDGFDLVIELAAGGAAADTAIHQVMGQDLARIGVGFEVRSITIPDMITKFNFGGWEGDGFNMDFNTKPSLDALRPFVACLTRKLWHCRDSLVEKTRDAQSTWDPDKRLALVRELLKAYHDDPPMLYMHDTVMFDGLSSRVVGYAPVNLIVNYHDLRLANSAP
ncbi:MAG: ABC transporter substrate-binding protein [Rhodospirillaceae bacterium]|jgi:peptide/nickel transport system substrate-binding protein|nr:ABC transporter substrate-binding protein [Rhodospirillaceae bacterium]MBT5566231.1 ABC transporter substrate-binding protein [Rhodospirillaceae bacterium]MBT6088949.1 ABC transporter substrate-binding protein [Rhodospirillaceae bacterium]MBT6961597.1 ABC transporter substrate-binding protein [Rhodospirillaceae bacterium]MBT7451192.1 ABC transporter substrate-binding protein [Rhodospirillaceae bacterium]